MLQLRPNCECCDKDLPPESTQTRICSFECTFCASCAEGPLSGKCPNCGGELVARPRRPANKLANNPPSTERIYNPAGCVKAMTTNLLTPEIKAVAQRSVLCWLATADKNGVPNVSPKEVFALVDDEHMVMANIASPQSAQNIQVNENVCVSFIDVFVQKGFKVTGVATDVRPSSSAFARWVEPLRAITGDRFPIHSVFVVRAVAVQAIEAPSYKLYPAQTTEASQMEAAYRTYGVLPIR